MQAIVEQCNYHLSGNSGLYEEDFIQMSVAEHADKPAVTLRQAANLIFSVWKDKDRDCMQMFGDRNFKLPDRPSPHAA
jgi:hypothetical protein